MTPFSSLTRSRLIALAAAAGAFGVASSAAQADSLPSGCAQSGQTVTCSYAYTGGEQQFEVPVGITGVHVNLIGGRGFSPDGYGAEVGSDLAVTPGETLFVEVGGKGGAPIGLAGGAGGFNGGGSGGQGNNYDVSHSGVDASGAGGGGGGGASDIRTCSRDSQTCDTLASRLVVAAGGGGFGGSSAGGNGGDPNGYDGAQDNPNARPGGGATLTAGGVGQFGSGEDGTLGQGGASNSTNGPLFGGGGGGGGYYGGAAGAGGFLVNFPQTQENTLSTGGGGGGSSYGPAGTSYSIHSDSTDPASVTISYQAPAVDTTAPTISIATPRDGATYVQGQQVVADYSCSDNDGGSGIDSCVGDTGVRAPIDTSTVGTHSFTVTAIDVAGNRATKTVHYTVGAPRADLKVTFTGGGLAIQPGGRVTETVTVRNTGPSAARSVRTMLTASRGFTIVSAGGGRVRHGIDMFAAANLDSGASLTYTVVLKSGARHWARPLVAAATFAATIDPNLRNNVASTRVRIVRPQRHRR